MALQVLVPVFLVLGAGWLVGGRFKLDPTPLVRLTFWLLSPALIFQSLLNSDLPTSSYGLVAGFVVAHYGGLFLLSLPLRRLLFPGQPEAQAAASLALVFGNCGNLGLPILYFAFGDAGVDVGAVFLATNTVLIATLGVLIASWEGAGTWRRALGNLVRVPWPYAVVAALAVRSGLALPQWLTRATGLLAQGAIPAMLLLLGVQLAQVRPREVAWGAGWLAGLRLGLASLWAWALAALLGLQGVLRGSLILEGSVPTAVNSFLLASQFGRRPDLVAAALLLSTLLSLGTLSLTLHLLG